MEKENIKVGTQCRVQDDETPNWYLHEVIEIEPKIKVKDIDSNSNWKGMDFEVDDNEINDKKYIRWI